MTLQFSDERHPTARPSSPCGRKPDLPQQLMGFVLALPRAVPVFKISQTCQWSIFYLAATVGARMPAREVAFESSARQSDQGPAKLLGSNSASGKASSRGKGEVVARFGCCCKISRDGFRSPKPSDG